MGWLASILTSGPARKALGILLAVITIALLVLNLRRAGERAGRLAARLLLAVITIALLVLNLRRAGERAGRLAARLSTSERTHEIQRQMLDAASRRPADRDALAQRMRDGRF